MTDLHLPWFSLVVTASDGGPVAYLQGPRWKYMDKVLGFHPEDAAAIVERMNGWDALVAERDAALAALPALQTLIQYARWQILEGESYHPTLPSATTQAIAALKAAGWKTLHELAIERAAAAPGRRS